MTTRLFLIRHGETLSNLELIYQGQGDSMLSELGLKEGAELGSALSCEPFSVIYSSTLTRSYDTAKLIAQYHDLEVIKDSGLIERNYGEFEGLNFLEIKSKFPDIYEKWLKHPHLAVIPGAETLEALQARGVAAIEKLISKHKDQSICVVGHGGINRTILFHFMNLTLDNFWRVKQDNCCVNIIELDGRPTITLLNSTWFLGEKRISKISVY